MDLVTFMHSVISSDWDTRLWKWFMMTTKYSAVCVTQRGQLAVFHPRFLLASEVNMNSWDTSVLLNEILNTLVLWIQWRASVIMIQLVVLLKQWMKQTLSNLPFTCNCSFEESCVKGDVLLAQDVGWWCPGWNTECLRKPQFWKYKNSLLKWILEVIGVVLTIVWHKVFQTWDEPTHSFTYGPVYPRMK